MLLRILKQFPNPLQQCKKIPNPDSIFTDKFFQRLPVADIKRIPISLPHNVGGHENISHAFRGKVHFFFQKSFRQVRSYGQPPTGPFFIKLHNCLPYF